MNANTPCYIIRFNEFVRAACLEVLGQDAYGSVTVSRSRAVHQIPSWQATIGFAREIRTLGEQQGKPMKFQVVASRKHGGSNRFIPDSEWNPLARNKRSLKKTVQEALKKTSKKPLVRARVGNIGSR